MYLKRIDLENVGPLRRLELEAPFNGDGTPKPIVFVGTNGSGKTTVISFIVNALIAFKQQAFDEAEVDFGKVFRIRSGLYRRLNASFYHAHLAFQDGCTLDEWVLDRSRERFEKEVMPLPNADGWRKINKDDFDLFETSPHTPQPQLRPGLNPKLLKIFSENAVLYFPSDRFEPPDWLNQQNLSTELDFPEPVNFKGRTARRIFRRSLLKSTLDWLQAVLLDLFLQDRVPVGYAADTSEVFTIRHGKNKILLQAVTTILAQVLGVENADLKLAIESRNARRFSVNIKCNGKPDCYVPNLLGLSAGQSALFCLFCNILRDFDLSGASFEKLEDIRGIVIIDEADLHLHLDLQHRVLPKLIKLFPRIQFIVTVHSPLFVMGMRDGFSENGFCLIDMPSGQVISAEVYSEFVKVFEAFGNTMIFQAKLLDEVKKSSKPLVLVEGKHDKEHLEIAWSKLYPMRAKPFEILSCANDGIGADDGGGGAKRLNATLHLLQKMNLITAVGIFDNDEPGAGQFGGLKKRGFFETDDPYCLRCSSDRLHALLLPTPNGRQLFDDCEMADRVLELEHYYSDPFLTRHQAAGRGIFGSQVFRIENSKKAALVEAAKAADTSEFSNFTALFDKLIGVLGVTIY